MSTNTKLFAGIAIAAILGAGIFMGMKGQQPASTPAASSSVATTVTADIARSLGNEFVVHVHARAFEKAYAMLHKNLQAKITLPAFEKLILDNKADKVESVIWSAEEVGGGIRTVKGISATGDMNVIIKATELENNAKPGIILFHFFPAKK